MIVVERRDVVINDIMIAIMAIYEYAQLSAAALEQAVQYGSHGGPTQMVAVEFVNHCKKKN